MTGQDLQVGPITWLLIAVWLVYALAGLVFVGRTFIAQLRGARFGTASLRSDRRRNLVLGIGHVFWAFLLALSAKADIPNALLLAALIAVGVAISYSGASTGIKRVEREEERQSKTATQDGRR